MHSVRNGRKQLSGSGKSGYERREVASGPGNSMESVLIAIVIGVFGEC